MGKSKYLIGGALAATVAYWAYNECKTKPANAVPVQPFDLEKYLGKWYEIARIDYFFEKNLSNTTAEYSLNEDGSIRVLNRGFDTKKGEWVESIGKAKQIGEPYEAKLKVSFFGPFYSGYNVIAIDENYNNALVCGKNLGYLWILSRKKTISERTKNNFLKIAESIGYNTSRLIWVDHD